MRDAISSALANLLKSCGRFAGLLCAPPEASLCCLTSGVSTRPLDTFLVEIDILRRKMHLRADAIHTDAPIRILHRCRLAQANDAVLRCYICAHVRPSIEAGGTRNVDNATPVLDTSELGRNAVESSRKVGSDHTVPVFRWEVMQRKWHLRDDSCRPSFLFVFFVVFLSCVVFLFCCLCRVVFFS